MLQNQNSEFAQQVMAQQLPPHKPRRTVTNDNPKSRTGVRNEDNLSGNNSQNENNEEGSDFE